MLGQTLFALTALAGIVVAAPAQSQARTIENVEWTVKNFTRVCDGYPLTCSYDFTISPGEYTPDATCGFEDSAPPDPVHNSLSSVPCNTDYGNPWVISWGYNSAYDSAVMTVVNEAEQYDAWFGWNSVSTTTVFPDVGPNPVYALGTFS